MDNGHLQSQENICESTGTRRELNDDEGLAHNRKSAWKAKREGWIKPENALSEAGSKSSTCSNSNQNSVPEDDSVILESVGEDSGEQRRSVSPGRRKSLPPIKVPEKTAEVPVIVSRAIYNRCG